MGPVLLPSRTIGETKSYSLFPHKVFRYSSLGSDWPFLLYQKTLLSIWRENSRWSLKTWKSLVEPRKWNESLLSLFIDRKRPKGGITSFRSILATSWALSSLDRKSSTYPVEVSMRTRRYLWLSIEVRTLGITQLFIVHKCNFSRLCFVLYSHSQREKKKLLTQLIVCLSKWQELYKLFVILHFKAWGRYVIASMTLSSHCFIDLSGFDSDPSAEALVVAAFNWTTSIFSSLF